jgi:Fic-DOC domain mobile mystery protein B
MNAEGYQPEYLPGATPLDPNEVRGLIPTYISTQGELNALEQENILRAEAWLGRRRKLDDILNESFLIRLHTEMFGDVWRWAGKYRTTDKSIGVPWQQVPTAVHNLLENTRYQIENRVYPLDEIAARFHHRLVEIHPFANGNGRHARYATDALLTALSAPTFSWGRKRDPEGIDRRGVIRDVYIAALKEADAKRIAPLLAFVRS